MTQSPGRIRPLVDMHVHSSCSADGGSSMAEYLERAGSLGLQAVGFCEHADFDPRDSGCGTLDLACYDRAFSAARVTGSGVSALQGIEITYQSSRDKEIRAWLSSRAWDFVVSSVHLVDYEDGWTVVSDPEAMGRYCATHSESQVYRPYFGELLKTAQSGLGDVLGHLDLVKRYGTVHYGPFDPVPYEPEIRAVLRVAVDAGMAVELNTSGLRQLPREPYPSLTVLRWYRQLGGEVITIGSDAHCARDLGAGLATGVRLARAAGFRAVAVFQQRQPRWVTL